MTIHSTARYGNIYFIGTIHNGDSSVILSEIKQAPFTPSIVCVEAPEGLDPSFAAEHEASVQYRDDMNIPVKEIDKRRGDYVPDRDPVNVENINEFEDPRTKEAIKKGFDESINPNAAEHRKERDQMMALEIKKTAKKHDKIIVIIGGYHIEGVLDSLQTLENKYNF